MPRIAAVIGVFAVVAICIFVNIKRYPSVWNMVGTSPWFTQDANIASQAPAPEPTKVAENAAPEKPAPQPEPEKTAHKAHAHKPLPSLRPEPDNHSTAAADLLVGSSAGESIESASSSDVKASQTQTAKMPAYQGLNPGPIKIPAPVSEPVAASGRKPKTFKNSTSATSQIAGPITPPGGSGQNWPAEMSPKMKYAAKPPLLESSQQWNSERPMVPVVRPKKDKKKNTSKPDPKDSSKNVPAKQTGPSAKSDDDVVVRRLPRVDPKRRPIRMSIQGDYPAKPIPVYPSTGRTEGDKRRAEQKGTKVTKRVERKGNSK